MGAGGYGGRGKRRGGGHEDAIFHKHSRSALREISWAPLLSWRGWPTDSVLLSPYPPPAPPPLSPSLPVPSSPGRIEGEDQQGKGASDDRKETLFFLPFFLPSLSFILKRR